MWKSIIALASALLFILVSGGTTGAAIIGFEGLVYGSSSYAEDNFLLTTNSSLRSTSGRGNPPPELYAASTSQTNTLSHVDGTPFDLLSIELAGGPSAGGTWPQTITFTGEFTSGGSVSQSFIVAGSEVPLSNWQAFTFNPEFRLLSSVSWGPQYTLADNIEADSSFEDIVIVVEPDDAIDRADISNMVEGVTLSAQGGNTSDNRVYAYEQSSPTGSRSFGWYDGTYYDGHWGRNSSPVLRAEFEGFLARQVSIDYEFDLGPLTLEAFAEGGGSLGRVTATSGTGTLHFAGTENTIASVQFTITPVGGADFGTLDHMVIRVPEPSQAALACSAFTALGLLRRRRRS